MKYLNIAHTRALVYIHMHTYVHRYKRMHTLCTPQLPYSMLS